MASITYPSGRIVSYVRDAQGRITSVTTKQTSASAAVNVATGITYQPLSRLVAGMTYGNTLTEANTWNLDHALSRCVVNDGATLHVDRTLARADSLNITSIVNNITAANNQTYAYNSVNRLQNGDGPWGTKTFQHDSVGNRVQEASTVSSVTTTDVYGYPPTSNRLVQVTRGAATVRAMTYDGGGNMLTDNRAGSTTTYTYNNRNRLATTTSGALVWGYASNGREQLVSRTLVTGGTNLTHFVHDIFGNVLAETNGTAAGTNREYIWLPDRNRR